MFYKNFISIRKKLLHFVKLKVSLKNDYCKLPIKIISYMLTDLGKKFTL